jgi:hypothetical protein
MIRFVFLQALSFFFMSCIFSEFVAWDPVCLVSFPRSGNHWVRFLVEEASHIATSSVYKDGDYPHLSKIFPWGGYCPDHGYKGTCRYPLETEAVLLKTHYPFLVKRSINPTTRMKICLIRHPIDALYSFHVYRKKEDKGEPIPSEILYKLVSSWKSFYEFWGEQENVLMIRYEDLYENPAFYLRKILNVLEYPVEDSDIQRAIEFFPPQGGLMKKRAYYKEDAIEFMRRELNDLLLKWDYVL